MLIGSWKIAIAVTRVMWTTRKPGSRGLGRAGRILSAIYCGVLAKNVVAFSPCLKICWRLNWSFGLMYLVEEMSHSPLLTMSQGYQLSLLCRWQWEGASRERQYVQFGEKRESRSVINCGGLDSKWNKGRGNLRTRPHPANPATHEKKRALGIA